MHFHSTLATGLWASAALAFQDTSPFFALSTSDTFRFSDRQVATSKTLLNDLRTSLDKTQSDVYVIISQPGVSPDDFRHADAAAHMRRRLTRENESIQSTGIISEVVGGVTSSQVEDALRANQALKLEHSARADIASSGIKTNDQYPHILHIDLPALPTSGAERSAKLAKHDSFINAVIDTLDHTKSYTLLYTTTPPSHAIYEQQSQHKEQLVEKMIFDWDTEDSIDEVMHTDLKRDLSNIERRDNTTLNQGAPLFEKYNFFSPGIFAGLVAFIVLFSIGSIGVNALGSLQVSYAAFSKEMGPQAQKKQQ